MLTSILYHQSYQFSKVKPQYQAHSKFCILCIKTKKNSKRVSHNYRNYHRIIVWETIVARCSIIRKSQMSKDKKDNKQGEQLYIENAMYYVLRAKNKTNTTITYMFVLKKIFQVTDMQSSRGTYQSINLG